LPRRLLIGVGLSPWLRRLLRWLLRRALLILQLLQLPLAVCRRVRGLRQQRAGKEARQRDGNGIANRDHGFLSIETLADLATVAGCRP
jgi:hypothetical protein